MNPIIPAEDDHWRAEYLIMQPDLQHGDCTRVTRPTRLERIVGYVIWLALIALVIGLVVAAVASPAAWEWAGLGVAGSVAAVVGAGRVTP